VNTDEILAAVERQVRYHAKTLARRCVESGLDADDLAQEARAAVVASASGYDPDQTVPSTYFARRIRGAMLDAIRCASFAPRLTVERGEPLVKVERLNDLNYERWKQSSNGTGNTFARNSGESYRVDPAHHDPEPADDAEVEFMAVASRLCRGLSARERAVLRWYYCRGWTMKEIGNRLGLSEARVSLVHSELIGRAAGRQRPTRERDTPAVRLKNGVPPALVRRLAEFGLAGREFAYTGSHWSAVVPCPHCGGDRHVSLPTVTNWVNRGRVVPRCAACPQGVPA
jgi:RNA polymerase sigma factor FliA